MALSKVKRKKKEIIVINDFQKIPRWSYFNKVQWILRDGVWSLSSQLKDYQNGPKEASWQELVRYFQYHNIYRDRDNPSKYMSMYNQYACHSDLRWVVAGKNSTTWNIEPSKSDKCN